MKFLIDVCAGRSIAQWLRSKGYDVKEIRCINPKMSNEEILRCAQREGRILITMDKDFSELTILFKKSHCGMIRLENLTTEDRIKNLKKILNLHLEDLKQKAIIIQRGDKLRIIKKIK